MFYSSFFPVMFIPGLMYVLPIKWLILFCHGVFHLVDKMESPWDVSRDKIDTLMPGFNGETVYLAHLKRSL